MAEIRPFRAWRYNESLSQDIDQLTSPLFDVISEKQRQALYQQPLNSIHLSVPPSEAPAKAAAETLSQWKTEGILQQDPLPAIYVYYQYFTLPGSHEEMVRKGFISFIRLHDWDEKVILRHENTIPASVEERVAILESTQLNVSPTHGLYTDSEYQLEALMDEAIQAPLYETEDYQGARDVLAIIQDRKAIEKFQKVLEQKPIILADGHHRLEGSLTYWKEKRRDPDHDPKKGYNFHLMYFTNTESKDLRILPTHRLIQNLPEFNEDLILSRLQQDFTLKPVENAYDMLEVIWGKTYAFGLVFKNRAFKIRLKPEKVGQISWKFPDVIRELPLTNLHYFVIEKAMGIAGKDQRASDHLYFDRNFADCLLRVQEGKAQCALITQDVSMEEIKKVCYSGFTMPQKSTYFYPKVISGYLFGSIADGEF